MSQLTPLTPLAALGAVVLDTETTGLDARMARVIQIGAVRVEGETVRDGERFDRLVDPGVPIPLDTIPIHGITDAAVRGAPGIAALLPELAGFIGGAVVIGHTVSFDVAVLTSEARRVGLPPLRLRTLDVRALAEVAMPGLAQYDLDRIAAAVGVAVEGRHTAIGDAITTARVFAALLPRLRQAGIRTLADVDLALRTLADRQIAAGRTAAEPPLPAADRAAALARIDSFPYRHLVQDVMSAPVAWAPSETTVADAIRVLLERRISSVLVADAALGPGIATERDLLRAIAQQGAEALAAPVSRFATRPLETVPADAFVYRAIGRLERLGFRHLAVTGGDGAVVGMVTTRNLLRHRATTAIALGDEIDAASDTAALARVWPKLTTVARTLIEEEVDARLVASVASTEICALTRRTAELAERRMREAGRGPAPCPYALLVLGSAGRGESLLAADQDNAIVYAEGAPGGPEDQWFEAMAGHMCAMLDAVGVPYCKGGVMAKNAAWRQSVAGWRETVGRWVRRQRPEDLLNVDIFFDAAVVHGEAAIGEEILALAWDTARRAPDFQSQLTEIARHWTAPLSLFGNLKVDASGRIDLKKTGILPIFTAARVLAIKHGLRARGTPARLRGFAATTPAAARDVETLIDAHGTILAAMLDQQIADIDAGVQPSPRVDPRRLGERRLAGLKAAVRSVGIATALVGEGRL